MRERGFSFTPIFCHSSFRTLRLRDLDVLDFRFRESDRWRVESFVASTIFRLPRSIGLTEKKEKKFINDLKVLTTK